MSDDQHTAAFVERFHSILAARNNWHSRQGEPGTYEMGGQIVGQLVALIRDSGLGDVELHRFCADARGRDEDDPPDETVPSDAGILRGIARFTSDFAPAVVGPKLARTMTGDALLRSMGEHSVIGRDIPRANRQQPYPAIAAAARDLSIGLAHYLAGLNGTNWLAEHEGIVDNLGDEGRRAWRKAADRRMRKLARSAGDRRRRQLPLSADELALEDRLLRNPPERLRRMLGEIR